MKPKRLTKKEIRKRLAKTPLNAGAERVLWFMSDGKWHNRAEIELAASRFSSRRALEGMRRMRELRDGFTVQKRKVGPFQYNYRLVA